MIRFEDELLQPLQNTMNSILEGGKMPWLWGKTNIALIPRWTRLDFNKKYRSISLLNNAYKLF